MSKNDIDALLKEIKALRKLCENQNELLVEQNRLLAKLVEKSINATAPESPDKKLDWWKKGPTCTVTSIAGNNQGNKTVAAPAPAEPTEFQTEAITDYGKIDWKQLLMDVGETDSEG